MSVFDKYIGQRSEMTTMYVTQSRICEILDSTQGSAAKNIESCLFSFLLWAWRLPLAAWDDFS